MTTNVNTYKCDDERLSHFLNGTISESQTTELESHLEHCESCSQRLSESSAEPLFWSVTKQFLSSSASSSVVDNDILRSPSFEHAICDVPMMPTDDPMMLGRFGGYEICGVIGRGGMGVVLKGWDRSLDRYVAVKVLSPSYAHQSAARLRFDREAKAAAAVVHENVVAIHGVDSCNGLPYLVMPYVKGESLQRRIEREAPLSIESMLEISLQIASGLQAAHELGLVHRDIKPANILLPQSVSRVLITDFGLARAADDANLTSSGVIAGTPAYMSPEQARGENVDGRTDLYSLGSLMYAMACGHPPFRSESSYGVLRRITDDRHRQLRQVQPNVPQWFESIVDRLLEKKPKDRFSSADALASHLENCLAHVRQPLSTSLPKLGHSARAKLRHLLITTTCVVIGALTVVLWQIAETETNQQPANMPVYTGVSTPADRSVAAVIPQTAIQSVENDAAWVRDLDRLEFMLDKLNKELEE